MANKLTNAALSYTDVVKFKLSIRMRKGVELTGVELIEVNMIVGAADQFPAPDESL